MLRLLRLARWTCTLSARSCIETLLANRESGVFAFSISLKMEDSRTTATTKIRVNELPEHHHHRTRQARRATDDSRDADCRCGRAGLAGRGNDARRNPQRLF